MTHEKNQNLGGVQAIREGVCIDDIPGLSSSEIESAIKERQEARNTALELFSDSVFYKAAKKLVELLDDEDPNVVVKAAGKLLDLRKEVYKMQSTKRVIKSIGDKLFDDGFDF